MGKQVLITTRVGKYVWWPALQVIDFIPKGHRIASFVIQLRTSENTELGAMIKATTDMLKHLKETKAERNNETT